MNEKDLNKLMGFNLRKYRQRLDLSLSQFAERVGSSRSYICQIENGERGVGKDLMIRIWNQFGLHPSKLFEMPTGRQLKENFKKARKKA